MKLYREPIRDPDIKRRFLETMELFETAVALQRQNLRRRYPGLSEAEVDDRLQEWLLDRPETFTSSPGFRRSDRWRHLERP